MSHETHIINTHSIYYYFPASSIHLILSPIPQGYNYFIYILGGGDINPTSQSLLTLLTITITTMVYAFTLPTTSHLSFQTFLSSNTHPSLPQAASTARHALRVAVKTHKRLPRGPKQDAHVTTILHALNDYLPYLFAISHGLSGKAIENSENSSTEEVEIVLRSELESEWRATLSSTSSLSLKDGASNGRVRGRGIDYEIAFTLSILGYVLGNLAHCTVVRTLYAPRTPTPEQRTAAVQTATKHLLQASAVHSFLASSTTSTATGTGSIVPDIDPTTQVALSSLALAEATLLAVLKDDSYVATCIQARNSNDKDWMVRAPEIPKVRAMLFARLCVRAAEYAEQATAGLGTVGADGKMGVEDDLVKYARVLGCVARARACRFFGVDAELAGKVGEGIAWLRAAKGALGLRNGPTGVMDGGFSKREKGFSKLKREWTERREERKMEKGAGSRDWGEKHELDPGDNAGREEEGRVIEMLETKWVRMNDTVSSSPLELGTTPAI